MYIYAQGVGNAPIVANLGMENGSGSDITEEVFVFLFCIVYLSHDESIYIYMILSQLGSPDHNMHTLCFFSFFNYNVAHSSMSSLASQSIHEFGWWFGDKV